VQASGFIWRGTKHEPISSDRESPRAKNAATRESKTRREEKQKTNNVGGRRGEEVYHCLPSFPLLTELLERGEESRGEGER